MPVIVSGAGRMAVMWFSLFLAETRARLIRSEPRAKAFTYLLKSAMLPAQLQLILVP